MSAHRNERRRLVRKRGRLLRRLPTPMGRLYYTLRRLRLHGLFTSLMRKPCHVADIYIGDRFYDERYLMPDGDQQELKQMQASTRASIQGRSMQAMAQDRSHLSNLIERSRT